MLAACKPTSYNAFVSDLGFEAPLEMYDIEDYEINNRCTALPDSAPYSESIVTTIEFIKENIGKEFYAEATDNLNGIVYNAVRSNDISALYHPDSKKIELYESLFEFGCVEEVASTLIHEMVHSIQHERYLKPGEQLGEHNLFNGDDLERTKAELDANAYQLYLAQKLRLTGPEHTQKIINLANTFRSKFNELMSTRENS